MVDFTPVLIYSNDKMSTVVIIPSRLAATRLPNKPLADINGKPMVIRVLECTKAAYNGPIYVACGDQEIYDIVTKHGGKAVMTDPNIPSGTDRVFAAYQEIRKTEKFDNVVNLQGDMPKFDPAIVSTTIEMLNNTKYDIVTVAAEVPEEEAKPFSVVKPVFSYPSNDGYANALYFSRSMVPYGAAKYYHHIGIYGFRADILEKFVSLPQSKLEKEEKLEQLRALENGMSIGIGFVKDAPISVDTPDDLKKAIEICTR